MILDFHDASNFSVGALLIASLYVAPRLMLAQHCFDLPVINGTQACSIDDFIDSPLNVSVLILLLWMQLVRGLFHCQQQIARVSPVLPPTTLLDFFPHIGHWIEFGTSITRS